MTPDQIEELRAIQAELVQLRVDLINLTFFSIAAQIAILLIVIYVWIEMWNHEMCP